MKFLWQRSRTDLGKCETRECECGKFTEKSGSIKRNEIFCMITKANPIWHFSFPERQTLYLRIAIKETIPASSSGITSRLRNSSQSFDIDDHSACAKGRLSIRDMQQKNPVDG